MRAVGLCRKIARMNPFKAWKDKPKPGPERTLDQLVFDVAEHHRAQDREMLLQKLQGLTLFIPIISSNIPLERGQRLHIEPGMKVHLRTMSLQGLPVLSFLLHQDDPRLGEEYGAMTVEEIMDMIEASEQVAGFVFYNNQESFFGLGREDFPRIRAQYFKG